MVRLLLSKAGAFSRACLGYAFRRLFTSDARAAHRSSVLRIGSLLLAVAGFGAANLAAQVNFGSAAVGTTTPVTQTVTLTSGIGSNSPVIASISVLTQGAPNLDFTNAGTGTCATGQSLTTGQTCTVIVNFKPKVAGARNGAVVLQDSAGFLIATEYLQGAGAGPQAVFSQPTVSYVGPGYSEPTSVAVDGAGNVYVADLTSAGLAPEIWVTKYAPTGGSYEAASIITGTDAEPVAIALDGAGNVFLADYNNARTTEWVPNGGGVYKEQGLNVTGHVIEGIAVDGGGNVYLQDPFNKEILKETPSAAGYAQSTISFSGVTPNSVAVDGSGNLYIGDDAANAVYKETLSGGSFTQSTVVSGQYDLMAADAAGDVYVLTSNGLVKEVPSGETYTPSAIMLANSNYYTHIALDGADNIYFTTYDGADANDGQVYKGSVTSPPSLSFAATGAGTTSIDSPQTVTVQNVGNQPLNLSDISYPPDFPEAAGVATDCNSSMPLAAVATCTLSIDFSPLPSSLIGASTPLSETVSLTDNTLNQSGSVHSVAVSGTELETQPAAITSPVPGSALTGPTATFTWTTGTSVTEYSLHVGTTGAGSANVFGGAVTGESKSLTGIPTTGGTLYVRLYSLINGAWQYNDYTYTQASPAAQATISSPTPSSVLTSSTVTFSWTTGSQVTEYDLHVGTTGAGSTNVFGGEVTGQSKSISGIPTNGATLNVRLYSLINGAWQYNDYTYTEESPAAPATMLSPTPGGTLASSTATFSWTTGSQVTNYDLHVGTTGVGSDNIFGGSVSGQSKSITGIPTAGATLNVRLYSLIAGTWQYSDYTYTEASPAASATMTSPTPGSPLAGSTVTFSWTAGSQVTQYSLHVGTTGAGSDDIFGGIVSGESKSVSGIPTTGGTLYVRLYSLIAGAWQYNDYTYTEQ